MEVQTFDIEHREKNNEGQIAQYEDFTLRASHTILSQVVLNNPNISLYCLDPKQQNAVFVETPPDINLAQVPFFYIAQFDHAIRVIVVPYHELHHLAHQITLEGHQLILIYSIGRCGSTLTSKALNHADGVNSFAEPDVFSNLVALRDWNGANDREISTLVKSCTKVLCKYSGDDRSTQKWAIKFRGLGIELGDVLYQHFPAAKCLFLYRNLDEWANSNIRAFGLDTITPEMLDMMMEEVERLFRMPTLRTIGDEELSELGHMLGVVWLSSIERYLHLAEQGIPMLPVRYEDMKQNTLAVMDAIFSYCGVVPTNRNDLQQALKKDSQSGSILARDVIQERRLGSNHQSVMHELHKLLTRHPVITQPDFEVPGTLRVP